MSRDKWIKLAKQLPVGARDRVECCGQDKSRGLGHLPDRYITGCFRCGQNYVETKTGMARLSAERCKQVKEEIKKYTVPRDTTYVSSEFPPQAIAWLSKAGIHSSVWEAYKFGYTPKYNRVVVPIIQDGKRVGATLRALQDITPKYLMNIAQKGAVFTGRNNVRYGTVVITEDVLSAIRISEATDLHDVVCILGTGVMMERALYLASNYSRIHIWLDGDDAGVKATKKWRTKLQPYLRVSETTPESLLKHLGTKYPDYTNIDPKDLSDDEIRLILQEDM